jgi:CBS domain-containing protein
MSPRAAWRLERLGYDAYDYVLGKVDWIAYALPTEGERSGQRRVGDVLLATVPTSPPDADAEAAAQRALAVGWDACVIVNDARVILGRLRVRDAAAEHTAEDDMEPGPTTIRPSEELQPVYERMRRRGVRRLLVSNPAGVLLGALEDDGPDQSR